MGTSEELRKRFAKGISTSAWDERVLRQCLITFTDPRAYLTAWDKRHFKWMGCFGNPLPPKTPRPENLPSREEVAELLTERTS